MAGSAEILQEYLLKLGFTVDKLGQKKMDDALSMTGKRVLGVGAAVTEMVVAAEVAVGLFANQMQKLYYASKLSGSSAANFKALTSAETSIGLAGGTVERVTKGINLAMNSGNPAMKSYIQNVLGVKTAGRDMTAILISSAQAIKKMSKEQGDIPAKAAAARLGFTDEDYFQLIKTDGALEKLTSIEQKRQQYLESYGVDYQKVTSAGVEYGNMLDTLKFKMGAIKDVALAQLLPYFKIFNTELNSTLDNLLKLLKTGKVDDTSLWGQIKSGRLFHSEGYNKQKDALDEHSKAVAFSNSHPNRSSTGGGVIDKLQAMGWTKEQAAGIAGNLQAESNFNPSASGDHGHAYGIGQWQDIGPNSRQADFKKRYGKDIKGSSLDEQLSFLNYELTQGKEKGAGDRLRRAKTPAEAGAIVSKYYERPYERDAQASLRSANATRLASSSQGGGGSINQTNTFNITGTDGSALSKSVITAQARTNADAVRALGPRAS